MISGTLLAVVFLYSPFPVYGNGLVPIHRSPSTDIAGYGLLLSLVFAVVGLTIAFRRTGFAAFQLLLGAVLAGLTVFVCLVFVDREFGVVPALVAGSFGLVLFSALALIWYRMIARKSVFVGSIVILVSCAVVIAVLCVILFRLSIDHWAEPL